MGKFVDVSEHNTVDWAKAQKDVGAAYIRCGLRGSLAKTAPQDYKKIRADKKWAENLRAVQEYGIPFGAYYFPTAITAEEAVEGAEWFYNEIKDLEMTYPPMLDSEHVWGKDKEPGRANSLSREERTRLLKVVTDYFNEHGMNIGIYASASWLTSKVDMSVFPKRVRDCTWVADSTGAVDYDGYYWLHQYGKGPVAGSAKDIDLNRICAAIPPVVIKEVAAKAQAFPTTDPVQISNSGSDENGTYRGGKAGDQTGNEWRRRNWYDRPWNCVLRHPDAAVRACIAELAIKAADNDKIGYDQNQRTTYWTELQKAGFDPGKIRTACEADCSAGVIANVRAAGYILGRKELQTISATYTGNMRSAFKKAGFQVLTDSRYTDQDDYLLAGDILLNDVHHTATAITNGRLSGAAPVEKEEYDMPEIKKGSQGKAVKILQIILGGVTVDGDFGWKTLNAVIEFQKAHGLSADGIVGPKTWAELLSTL